MTSKAAKAWDIEIHRGCDHSQINLKVWITEVDGLPVDVRVFGMKQLQALLDCFCTAVSMTLPKAGVKKIVSMFIGRSDETGGVVVGDSLVTRCQSIPDYIARALGARYIPGFKPNVEVIPQAPQAE